MIQDILKSCGYPTDTVVLDAETYFDQDYSLKKLSTYEYVMDDRFELLGWAIKPGNKPSYFVRELPQFDWKNITVIMHHAPFDALVLAIHNKLYLPFIVDTLDLARHIEPRWSNKLADLCERHKFPTKGDTKQFKGLNHAQFDETLWFKLVEYATNDADREYDLLQLLLPKLSNPKFELEIARYTRDLFIRPTLHLDTKRAAELKGKMQAEVQKVLKHINMTDTQARSNKFFETQLRKALGSEEPPMKSGKKGRILAIAKTDPGYAYLLNHPNDQARQLMEARVAVKSWPLHIKRIQRLQSIFEAAGKRMPIPLKYYGAHTGRWAGDEGINPQNFTARGHSLANEIRTLIEAPKGYMLIIADFSQIEARGVDWLAGQKDMVQAFAEGKQIYCEFAGKLIGHKVRKPKKTDDPEVAKWYGHWRQMGKIGILGCGYGMGPDYCMVFAKNTYKVNLTYPMAKRIITLYRKTHRMVVLLWEKVERAFRQATQYTSRAYELDFGLRFFREGNATVIQLPSTRKLYYAGARVEGTTRYPQLAMPNPGKQGGKTIYFWGGYLVENIIQALSRDILAEAVLNIEKLGVRIPLIVHDDMSVVVPEKEVETYQAQIEDIARTPPKWATGLPVDVECKVSKEYVK